MACIETHPEASMRLPPSRAIGWSVLGLTASIASSHILFDFLLAASILILLMLSTKKLSPFKAFISLSGPFFIPLLLIHVIVNPQFVVTNKIWLVPFRYDGLIFSLEVYSNLAVYLAVAICWWHVDRDYMVDWLSARNAPFFLIGLTMQASAMVPIIEKRGLAVLKAQTARGIATGPNLIHRLKAFPTIILPVITSLINEAEHRSVSLWSRGFGKYKFIGEAVPFGDKFDIIWIISAFFAPALSLYL